MKNRQGEVLGPEYIGEIYRCDTSKGSFYDVHSDGIEKKFRKGVITYEISWKNCQMNGGYKEYSDGFISKKGFYKDDKKTGEWTFYHKKTGNILEIINYKNDRYHGLYTKFDKNGNEILQKETNYVDGKRDGVEKDYDRETGKLYRSTTYVQDGRNGESIIYTSLDKGPSLIGSHHLYDFWTVIGPYGLDRSLGVPKGNDIKDCCDKSGRNGTRGWIYMNKTCRKNRTLSDDWVKCMESQKEVRMVDSSPINIKMNYVGGVLHGPLEISDPDDGHVYTSIEYFRGGKLGEYEIVNKEGSTIFKVNCLRGGGDFKQYSQRPYPKTGVCRKEGLETKYVRSTFSNTKKWYKYSETYYQNDELVSIQYFDDPYYHPQMVFYNEIDYSLVKDPSQIKGYIEPIDIDSIIEVDDTLDGFEF